MKTKLTIQTTATMTILATASLCVLFAPGAEACPGPGNAAKLNALRILAPVTGTARAVGRLAEETANQASNNSPLIVGTWEVTLFSGGSIYDHAIQQLSSDGNELQNSSVAPPLLGNVCFGVWTQQDARTFKLKHYGWDFDEAGNFTGTYILTATITVGTPAGPNTFAGTFVADTMLPSGKIDPAQHAEGTIQGTRITLD